jgi:NOL1/NOP2/fmu family ribosome biogenesis protein
MSPPPPLRLKRTESYFCFPDPVIRINRDGVPIELRVSHTKKFCYKQSDGESSRECTKRDLEEWYDSLTETSPHRDAIRWEISKMCFGKYTRNILRNKKRENR